jgi:hypothetical protein
MLATFLVLFLVPTFYYLCTKATQVLMGVSDESAAAPLGVDDNVLEVGAASGV